MRSRRLIQSLGLLIALLGLGFVARELVTSWSEVRQTLRNADPAPLIASVPIGLASFVLIGLGWQRCLQVLGAPTQTGPALRWYYVGQLGKYIPGGIWPIVGRGELARRGGVPAKIGYSAAMLSLAVTYIAAAAVTFVTLVGGGLGDSDPRWLWLALLVPAGLAALHPAVLGRLVGMVERLTKRSLDLPLPRLGVSIGLVVWHIPAWLGIGLATWLVALGFDPNTPDLVNIMFASTLSWLVGFLVVAAPGGIGVREGVFLATATSLSTSGVVVAVTVVSRLLFVLVDLVSAGVASLLRTRRARS